MSTISSNPSPQADIADQYRAKQAQLDDIKEANESEIKRLKENYEVEKEGLKDRFEASVQTDKLNHYDNLRNLKRQILREEENLNAAKRTIVDQKQMEIDKEQVTTEAMGKVKLDELKRKYAAAEELEHTRLQATHDEVKGNHRKSLELIMKDSADKINTFQEQKMNELEAHKANHEIALKQITDHFQELDGQVQNHYQNALQTTNAKAQAALTQQSLKNSKALSEYTTKQADPFYNLTRFESTVTDQGESVVLRVKIPEHERDKFKVQVTGNDLRISGTRSNTEKVEVEPGRWVSSSSFQNVAEVIPMNTPVDGRSLTVKEDGDWVEYTVQKYGANHRKSTPPNNSHIADLQDKAITQGLEFHNTLPKPTGST